ncbi:MAG: MarR family winged helix-turn-helix transcriptional regulator [Steroidobacteraceae bacterium]
MPRRMPAAAKRNPVNAIDPRHCVFRHLSRSLRSVAQHYDRGLRPHGLTAAQFTLLMTLARLGEQKVGALAAELAMDPSTVPRVLLPLRRRGWIRVAIGSDRRSRLVSIAEPGSRLLRQVLPHWQSLQAEALAQLAPVDWRDLRHSLAHLRQQLASATHG